METKEQCKNCEIINADCEGCKEFNKNIRNSDSETKEQKIKRLKKEIEEIKFYKSICIDTYAVGIYIEQIKKLEQELKELENDTRN